MLERNLGTVAMLAPVLLFAGLAVWLWLRDKKRAREDDLRFPQKGGSDVRKSP